MIIIGIAGGTCSGKTTLTTALQTHFQDEISVIYHDDYYKCRDNLSMSRRVEINYDHPDALDTHVLVEHLKLLKKGKEIECPQYDFSLHTRSKNKKKVTPKKVVIIDGMLLFHFPELRELLDIKIYVDSPADERIIRRIVRDMEERGRDLHSVIDQYRATVRPMHDSFVDPTKEYADMIIMDGRNKIVLEMLVLKIDEALKGED